MHYFTEKHHQKKMARYVIGISAVTLFFCSIWLLWWGVSVGNLQTTKAVGYSSLVIGCTAALFFLILATSVFALYVQKHPHKTWGIRTYTVLLFFWVLVFVLAPWYGRTQADWVVKTIDDNCANKKLYAVDAVYKFANA